MGFAFLSVLKLNHIKFLAKQELFDPRFGFIFRKIGGIPVGRFNNNNFVDQIVKGMKAHRSPLRYHPKAPGKK